MNEYSPDFKNKKFNNYDNTVKDKYKDIFKAYYQNT
jgi:hypothetical protein